MQISNIYRRLNFIIYICIGFSAFVAIADNNQQSTVESSSPTEIITVTGSRSIGFFREQLKKAEQDFYNALNSMTDNEEFKIDCSRKNNSFSKVSSEVCQPKYVELIMYGLTQDSLHTGSKTNGIKDKIGKLPSRKVIELRISKKRKEHLKEIDILLEKSPQLQQVLLNLNKAKQSLQEKKISVFGEKWVTQKNG